MVVEAIFFFSAVYADLVKILFRTGTFIVYFWSNVESGKQSVSDVENNCLKIRQSFSFN